MDKTSTKKIRQHMDSVALPGGVMSINWVRFVLKKVNALIWRLGLNRLKTRDNLDRNGIDLGSTMWSGRTRDNLDRKGIDLDAP